MKKIVAGIMVLLFLTSYLFFVRNSAISVSSAVPQNIWNKTYGGNADEAGFPFSKWSS